MENNSDVDCDVDCDDGSDEIECYECPDDSFDGEDENRFLKIRTVPITDQLSRSVIGPVRKDNFLKKYGPYQLRTN